MEITTTTTTQNPRRQAAVNAFAIVGFIVLIIIGIVLAVYAARYVPVAFNRLGSASAISSIFKSGDNQDPGLNVITSTTTVPFEPIATTTVSSETVATTTNDSKTNTSGSTNGTKTTTTTTTRTVRVPVTVPPPAPYGKADLSVRITATGYCSSDDPSSFHTSDNVRSNKNGGVQFAVKNLGTNVSGHWDFSYELPTSATQRDVTEQRSLNPGDEIDYTLCFESPKVGNNRTMSVNVDPRDRLDESNENNNSDSVQVDIAR